jgi:hypothetical protein
VSEMSNGLFQSLPRSDTRRMDAREASLGLMSAAEKVFGDHFERGDFPMVGTGL